MITAELHTMPMTEFRDKGRPALTLVAAGTPVKVFQHGDPAAVLIGGDEAARWVAIERAFSAFHGLGVHPDAVEDTATLGAVVAGRAQPPAAALRAAARARRSILDAPRTVGVADIQRRLATLLAEVREGRPTAIISSGRFAGVLIPADEYYRLRRLSRVVSWFRMAGLDLATATDDDIAVFVARQRGGEATEAGEIAAVPHA
jgi:prevent-host-death family protein